MSMPPEEFYGHAERPQEEGGTRRKLLISRMTSTLVFLRSGFLGAFIVIAIIHLGGPRFGLSGNGYDLAGLLAGFALGSTVEVLRLRRRGRRGRNEGPSAVDEDQGA